jgi:hypothetical protein
MSFHLLDARASVVAILLDSLRNTAEQQTGNASRIFRGNFSAAITSHSRGESCSGAALAPLTFRDPLIAHASRSPSTMRKRAVSTYQSL